MATYVLAPNGKVIKNSGNDTVEYSESAKDNKNKITNVVVELLGEFKAGRNYAEVSHDIFPNPFENDTALGIEDIKDLGDSKKLSNYINTVDDRLARLDEIKGKSYSGVIGKTFDLYPDAFGTQMNFNAAERGESINYYKAYNTFFDLDQLNSGRQDNETDVEIFADEAEMLYGVPLLLNEPDKFVGDLSNVFGSLLDMLLGAIIPITAMSVLQSLLQTAQEGPPDPFRLFGLIKYGKPDNYGKFISYVKIDPDSNPILAVAFNAIIEGLASVLNVVERLMNFPANRLQSGNVLSVTLQNLLKNIASFCIGYIYYLIPGFKLDQQVLSGDIARTLTALLSIITSLITISKSKHNYNLLIRKIVKNQYFRKRIQFKAKTITNKDGTEWDYNTQYFYQLSDFFHRFVGQRVAVGQQIINILWASGRNKYNKPFAVQKMNELPADSGSGESAGGLFAPISVGSSIFGGDDEEESTKVAERNFDKSIYSLTSLISTSSNSANNYLRYHNELINQNLKIYHNKEKRLDLKHVKRLEKIINSDYMPFSIQDLRTNELFKFHAFLNSYADNITPNWDDSPIGFGRMDPIKIYKGTSRNISLDFWLISMSNDDFDYMWWMINRLIALIYPQWSAPRQSNIENQIKAGLFNKSSKNFNGLPFAQPFTQIPTGSPVIRLRLGDLFKSNYSKKGLARIFGFDLTDNFNKSPENFNLKLADFQNYATEFTTNTSLGVTIKLIGYQIEGNTSYLNLNDTPWFSLGLDQLDFEKFNGSVEFECITEIDDTKYIQRSQQANYLSKKYGNFYWNEKDTIDLNDINNPKKIDNFKNDETAFPEVGSVPVLPAFKKLIYYPVAINNNNDTESLILLYEIKFPISIGSADDNDVISYNNILFNDSIDELGEIIATKLSAKSKNEIEKVQNNLNLKAFMSANGSYEVENITSDSSSLIEGTGELVNNPIVKAYESTLGEGLAGTIQSFAISYENEIPWEIASGSRAPIGVKISLGMSVIHDILPGLDDKGIMRAPTYRVGNINNKFFGNSVYQELDSNVTYTNDKPSN